MTFKSLGIELATVKVVIPLRAYTILFICLFFLLTKLTPLCSLKKKTKRRYHKYAIKSKADRGLRLL